MDFTELYKHTASLVSFSAGGHLILTAIQDRLIVRQSDTFQIARTWLLDDTISHIGWSRDSEYVFGACAKKGFVCVYKLEDENWNARIVSGAEGLSKAEWAPDGRSILCFSEWGIRVSIWSLLTSRATYIQFPKHPDRAYAFRYDGRYFVLAERHKSKDTIGVYDTSDSWKLVRHFPLPTSSLASLSLSPAGDHVVAWESPLDYKLYVYTLSGHHLSTFSGPEQHVGLGIKGVAWHPAGTFLSVGGWDDKVQILNTLTWTPITAFDLQTRLGQNVIVWKEPPRWFEATQGRGFLSYDRPQTTPAFRPSQGQGAKTGIGLMEWNLDGSMLLIRFDSVPHALLLYSFPPLSRTPQLHTVLLQSTPVLHARWSPTRAHHLALCCESVGAVYMWELERGAECVGVPAKKFEAKDIKWAPDGKALVIIDRDTFCCAFEVSEDDSRGDEAQHG